MPPARARRRSAPGEPGQLEAAAHLRADSSRHRHHAHGHRDRARTALREALTLFRQLDIPIEEAITVRALGALGDDGQG